MRKVTTLGAVAVALFGLGVAAAPAGAESTAVTFTIAGGGLSLSVPANPDVSLSTGPGLSLGTTSVTGALNSTTVTDSRGSLLGSWKVQVSSTAFAGPEASIPASAGDMYIDVTNVAGLAGMLTGGMVATGVATALTPADLGAATPATLVSGTTALTGAFTYTPTVKVTIPADAPAGIYAGTVTQTAS